SWWSTSADLALQDLRRQRARALAVDGVFPVALSVERGALELDVADPAGEEVDAGSAHHHAVVAAHRAEAEAAATVRDSRAAAVPHAMLGDIRRGHLRRALGRVEWDDRDLRLVLRPDTSEHEAVHRER